MKRNEKPVRLTNRSFTVTLEGNSVYTLSTTIGQQKGTHPASPPAAAFPSPYKDNFEGCSAGVTPKYTSAQKGTFETAKHADGKGLCLKQMMPKEGIPWCGSGGVPFTVLGDQTWTNYTVQADIMVAAGSAGIGGRYSEWGPYGGTKTDYSLMLQQDGTWSLMGPKEMVKVVDGKEEKRSLMVFSPDSAGPPFLVQRPRNLWRCSGALLASLFNRRG